MNLDENIESTELDDATDEASPRERTRSIPSLSETEIFENSSSLDIPSTDDRPIIINN